MKFNNYFMVFKAQSTTCQDSDSLLCPQYYNLGYCTFSSVQLYCPVSCKICSPINYCSTNPCINGASCLSTINGFTCTCPTGYTGVTCSTMINWCAYSQCNNGGSCTSNLNGPVCLCINGYSGSTCNTCNY